MKEEWRELSEYPFYRISNMGSIQSSRIAHGKLGEWHPMKSNTRNGYRIISLYNANSVRKKLSVHRLVAMAFIDNPESKNEVNHKNGIKWDNRVENLEWSTREENSHHAWKLGLQKYKLTDDDIENIKSLAWLGIKQLQIGNAFGITQGSVSMIVNNMVGVTRS